MKTKLSLLLICFTCLLVGKSLKAQSLAANDYRSVKNIHAGNDPVSETSLDISIRGRVVNKAGDPLQGVSVLVAGTQNGTTTNRDGRFTLSIPEGGNVTLNISSVGYQTQTVNVGNQTELNITLEENISG